MWIIQFNILILISLNKINFAIITATVSYLQNGISVLKENDDLFPKRFRTTCSQQEMHLAKLAHSAGAFSLHEVTRSIPTHPLHLRSMLVRRRNAPFLFFIQLDGKKVSCTRTQHNDSSQGLISGLSIQKKGADQKTSAPTIN